MDCHWDIPCISYCFCCKKLLKWPQRTSHSLSVYISETDESSQPVIDPVPNTNKPTETIEIKVDSGDTETNESKENPLTVDLPNDSNQTDNPEQMYEGIEVYEESMTVCQWVKCSTDFERFLIALFIAFAGIAMTAGIITIIAVTFTTDSSSTNESPKCSTTDPLPLILTVAGWCMLASGLVGTVVLSNHSLKKQGIDTNDDSFDSGIANSADDDTEICACCPCIAPAIAFTKETKAVALITTGLDKYATRFLIVLPVGECEI